MEKYRREAMIPQSFAPPPQKLLPERVVHFINRSREKAEIAKFATNYDEKRVLLLHGPAGIGKRELLIEVQRLQPDRLKWLRFRCTPNARLAESITQICAMLGKICDVPKVIDNQHFESIVAAAEERGATVLVLEDAHYLPIFRDHVDHVALLELLSYFCSKSDSPIKLILVSDHRGHLQFSGSHRMDLIQLEGLDNQYIVELLQEHIISKPRIFEMPNVDEFWNLAGKLHGHPFMAKLAAVVLEDCSTVEVLEKLYSRIETKNFVTDRLLSGIFISDRERRFLEFASILRVPVLAGAFVKVGGPSTNSLLEQLIDRFLIVFDSNHYRLHPVLTEYFQAGISSAEERKQLHQFAFEYFQNVGKRTSLTVDERIEYVYHGISCNASLDLADLQMFAGSIRSGIENAVRERDWTSVENGAKQLLTVWPYDVSGQVAMALALDGQGRKNDSEHFAASLEQVSTEHLWLAIEFIKCLIRGRDYDAADRNLSVVEQRFRDDPRVALARAQLYERKGETAEAVETCTLILNSQDASETTLFLAGLILKDANRLDLFVQPIEKRNDRLRIRNDNLLRLYSLSSVVTNYDPQAGLQVLSDIWNSNPMNCSSVADYANALISVGRVKDASVILERGLQEVKTRTKGYRELLEANALLMEKQSNFSDAINCYRDLVQQFPNHLHVYRCFSRCLLEAARNFHSDGRRANEDSSLAEAKQVLRKLLQMAPYDTWASDHLHRAEHRVYNPDS